MPAERKYLFYVTLSYSFSVLRPIEAELLKRGYKVAWFIPEGAEAKRFILDSDNLLTSVKQVKQFNCDAVLAPGNYIPDFFPGVKVQVFHGFDSGKKNKFNIRGFFDLYCTQGPNITTAFNDINDGTCEVIETGWSKLDPLFTLDAETESFKCERPIIFYAPTFSPKLTSTYQLYPHIKQLIAEKNWQWIIKLHPKANSEEIAMFKELSCNKATFVESSQLVPLLQAADVLLSDTSSILAEFALLKKPVVAFNNRRPESWLINFNKPEQISEKLECALNNDDELLSLIDQHCKQIHPKRDGLSSQRVVDAVDDLIERGVQHLKAKPLNLIRRLKMRKKLKHYHWN